MQMAQVFPVDPVSQVLVDATKADLVAWGVAFIAVALIIMAYRRIAALIDAHHEAEVDRVFKEHGL